MATTPILGLRYPSGSDSPAGMTQIQNLATDVDNAAVVLQGKKSIISAEQTTTTGLGYLGTPDKVTSIVVPTDGIIAVLFMALVKNTSGNEGRAAITLDSDQVTVYQPSQAAPQDQDASFPNDAGEYKALVSCAIGLRSVGSTGTPAHTAPSGHQVIGLNDGGDDPGGPCYIAPSAAGTYEVGVQFGADSGTTSVKNRRLWVWTLAFD